jgi:L-lactate dehydrogenase complex protein LldG
MKGSDSEARKNILARIRRAQGRAAGESSAEERRDIESHLAARQRGPMPAVEGDLVSLFRARAESLQSTTALVARVADVPSAIASYLEQHGIEKRGCVWPALAHLDWPAAGLHLASRSANGDDVVGVTGAFAALAETGTLMLVSGNDTPATVSLLPETHIAVVSAASIVTHMEVAWDRARSAFGDLPRSVNFVSGPSRTGDIEQKMVLGAHGPARVHIVVVMDR